MKYVKNIKNFKYWGRGLKRLFVLDILRNLIFMLVGVGLYLYLNNTGLLMYMIFMIKYHWFCEEES